MSEGGRRLRVRGESRGGRRGGKAPRNRLGSVSCSNEESTEGEDETVVRKVRVNHRNHRFVNHRISDRRTVDRRIVDSSHPKNGDRRSISDASKDGDTNMCADRRMVDSNHAKNGDRRLVDNPKDGDNSIDRRMVDGSHAKNGDRRMVDNPKDGDDNTDRRMVDSNHPKNGGDRHSISDASKDGDNNIDRRMVDSNHAKNGDRRSVSVDGDRGDGRRFDRDRGLRTEGSRGGHTRKRSARSVLGLIGSGLAEEDVIDGFLFQSYSTFEDAQSDAKSSSDPAPLADVGDILPDGQSEEKEEEVEIRNGISEHFGEIEPLISKEVTPDVMVNGDVIKREEEVGENNNEPTTPNHNFVVSKPVVIRTPKIELVPVHREPLKTKEVNCSEETNKPFIKICDTAGEEAKKVPPDLETPRPETPKQDVSPLPTKKSPSYPLKTNSSHFLPLQNGPLQPEPSTAVAAVTVPTSTLPASSHHQTPAPSSTSPAGGVPFPTSLLNHQEELTSKSPSKSYDSVVAKPYDSVTKSYEAVGSKSYDANSKGYESVSSKGYEGVAGNKGYEGASAIKGYETGNTKCYDNAGINPKVYDSVNVNSKVYESSAVSAKVYDPVGSKGYDSTTKGYEGAVKSPRGGSSDVQHPHSQYPVCSSYPDYTVSYSYSKQHYQEGGQRTHGNKVVTNNSYYNHHPPQAADGKYPGHKEVRSSDNCDAYENYRYESKAADLGSYPAGQTYEKPCDPQAICKKPSNASSVYNFKTGQTLTNENVPKPGSEKVGGKVTGELYSNINKGKIPNRTTYYQSIVNKSHSRHKSTRRVLPASAYENKQVINNYSSSKPELAQVQASKTVQYSPHHYSAENKKHDYYQSLSTASTGTTNTYNCNTYKSEPPQTHVSNSIGHNNYPPESQSSSSRNYKTSSDHSVSNYREKQTVPIGSTSTKPYSYHSSRNFVEPSTKGPTDTAPAYGNSDYYHKGSYSKSTSGNPSAISDTNSYKSSNHSGDHSTAYQSKSSSYHLSRTSGEKTGRSYYANQEGSYKSYRQDLVPKQNSEESHGYRNAHEGISYLNHGNSTSSLKSKESITHTVEPSKPTPVELVRSIPPESNSIPPPTSEITTHTTTTPRESKPTFYPYADPSHYSHQRTPPLPSSKPPFEPVTPTKDPEAFRHLGSSSTYPQRPTGSVTPPPDSARNGVAKTLWSPTATVPPSTANRDRDSHSSHSNSSISSLSQLSQSLGPATQQSKEAVPPKDPQRSNSRSSSRNENPVTTSTASSSSGGAYGVSGSLTSLIFSKASSSSFNSSSVLSSPSSHFTSGPSPVPSVLPLAPSLPSFGGGPHVMFAPPLPPPGSALSSPSLTPLAAPATGPSPFAGDSLFAPPPPPSTDLLNIRRELDTRFLASQDRSIAVPPPPYLRSEMHQHQHQHTHMHQHGSPFLPPPPLAALTPSAAAHLYDKFPKVDSSFYGRNALGLPTYPISPLLAPGSATATPTPFAPPGHMAAFQPKISPLVKAKSMKSGRWCAMHVRISWEIYRHQQKQQESAKGGGGGKADLLRPPTHLFGGALPRPHEMGFSPSPLMGAAGSIHARSPYDVTPQHPGFLGPTPAHLGITPFSRPSYPSIGIPGNSFAGLGGLGLSSAAAGMLGRGDLGPAGYLGMDPWSRLHHRTPPTFPPSGGPPGGSWGGLKAEADRMQQHKRSSEEQEKRRESEKRESEKSAKERESKKEHDKQKERDREGRPSHPDPLRNGDSTERNPTRERDWDRTRDRPRESSRSPLRTHKNSTSEDTNNKDIKVKEEKKEEEKDIERTKSPPVPHPDLTMDYMSRMPMALSPSEQARMAALLPPPPHHFWNHQTIERYRTMELQRDIENRELFMAKYNAMQMQETQVIERQLQADRDRQVYERTKQILPPFPHVPFMGGYPRSKTGSPMGNGVPPPPLIPCSAPGTPPLHLKEHFAGGKAAEVETQSR